MPDLDDLSDTLIIRIVGAESFASACDKIREVAQSPLPADSILDWVCLKGFRRIIAHFASVHDAALARQAINHKSGATAHAHFSAYNFMSDQTQQFLDAPVPDKQFIISPPASPPADWEPVREEPPNLQHVHPDDLASVLAAAVEEPQRQPSGALTRKRTIHEPLRVSTDCADVRGHESLPTPTITVEWEVDNLRG